MGSERGSEKDGSVSSRQELRELEAMVVRQNPEWEVDESVSCVSDYNSSLSSTGICMRTHRPFCIFVLGTFVLLYFRTWRRPLSRIDETQNINSEIPATSRPSTKVGAKVGQKYKSTRSTKIQIGSTINKTVAASSKFKAPDQIIKSYMKGNCTQARRFAFALLNAHSHFLLIRISI